MTIKTVETKRSAFLILIACSLVACASSGGVQQLGPETFTVSAAASPARGGYSTAKTMALNTANEHCTRLGKEILVSNIGIATTNIHGAGSADITFRCLATGHADLRRPEYRRAPDVVIEDRRQ